MKTLKVLSALLVCAQAYASTPVSIPLPVEHIYAPKGFHDHQETEVIISGYLPNLCHKSPKTEVKVKGKEIHVDVTALHYEPGNPFCANVLVPFVETVQVGVLDKGDYKIVVNPNSVFSKKSEITIDERSSDAIDDIVFANVYHVEKTGMESTVYLKGYNPSDCFVLDKIETQHNDKDTYSISPKMKQISDFCPKKMVPFVYKYEVPQDLKFPKVLLHVKAMDGRSVNTLYSNGIELE